jgi:spermidine synthase
VRFALLSVTLFLSGASALLFQTLWLRRSGLVFGNAIWSAALILSSFMAGLALGNAIAATVKRPRCRPLRIYAALEIAVAVTGVALVAGLPWFGDAVRPLLERLWSYPVTLQALRVAFSFALLVVPTTAMGLTLPVLLGDPMLGRTQFLRVTSVLYGCNTLGAVAGAFAGEAWLVARFGLTGTGVIAGTLNLAAAGCALLVAWIDPASPATDPGAIARGPAAHRAPLPWRWLAVSFATGAIFLALEVIWFRFLRLYVASSALAFATMVAVVLAGMGSGSLLSAALSRRIRRPAALLVPLLLGAGGLVLVTYVSFPVPPPTGVTGATFVEGWRQTGTLAFALMFPVAFVSGMLFPALVAQVEAQVGDRMNSAGLATLANTIGAAAGPLLAGFVLLPHLGFQSSLLLCAAAYGTAALVASERSTWSVRTGVGPVALGLGGLLAGAFALFPYHRDDVHLANARRPYERDGSTLRAKIEGSSDTFQLLERKFLGTPYEYRLLTNGFSMSGTDPHSQRYMRLFAHLPLALNPRASQVLLICYGVGVTADALAQDPQVARIDVVDIAPEVFTLSSCYAEPAHRNPLRDPRVTTWVQDGRFFLQASPRHYDIITGEPPPLKMAGTVNLYTEEFFSAMSARLNEGGIASFWLPIYQLKVDEVKAILRAFHQAFPNASVWGGPDHEWIMVGSKGPERPLREVDVTRLWATPSMRTDLARSGVETPEQLGGLFIMDAREMERITAGTPPLTDEFPKRLSDAAPDPAAVAAFAAPYMDGTAAFQRFRASEFGQRIWPARLRDAAEVAFAIRETRYRSETAGSNWFAELELYLRNTKLRTPVLDVLHTDEWRIAIAESAARQMTRPTAEVLPDLVAGALARRDFAAAIRWLETERDHPANMNDPFLLMYLYCVAGRVREAEAFAQTHVATLPQDWFTPWFWQQLRAEYGFRPPA